MVAVQSARVRPLVQVDPERPPSRNEPMLRAILGPSCSPVLSQIRALGHEASGSRSSPLSADQTATLRQWAASFRSSALDKSKAGCDVRFDRSGGKGGQAVNKQNTKVRSDLRRSTLDGRDGPCADFPVYSSHVYPSQATLTVSLAQAHWIPDPLKPTLTTSVHPAPVWTQASWSLLSS